jgi:hypothetical protein
MSGEPIEIEDLLGLPERARASHRLTKKDIAEQWEQSAPADARLLARVIASATIVGVLSPATIGAQAFHDSDHRVDMIPVLAVALVERIKVAERTRVAELLHRSMPRPAIIGLTGSDGELLVSLALTRLNRADEGMSVIEAHLLLPTRALASESLHVLRLERSDLDALYRDLVRTAAADGVPASAALTAAEAVRLRQNLASLETELETTARDATREKVMQRRIEINMRARSLRVLIDEVRNLLYGEISSEWRRIEQPMVGQ